MALFSGECAGADCTRCITGGRGMSLLLAAFGLEETDSEDR